MAEKIGTQSVVLNLEIDKGSTFRHTLLWQYQADPQDPIDLTGCTARMQIRPTVDSTELYHEMTTENGGITLGGAAGTIVLFISDGDSTAFTWKTGVYDLEIVFPTTDVRRLTQGKVTASDETTRDQP